MNPNVGRIVNGNAVLDRATFSRVVEQAMLTNVHNQAQSGVGATMAADVTDSTAFANLSTPGHAFFSVSSFDITPYVSIVQQDGGGEAAGFQVTRTVDVPGIDAYAARVIADPNTLFILDCQRRNATNDKQRMKTLYYRKNDVVLPLATHEYTDTSTWVDSRAGIIFVFGVVFSIVGAPVLSAELSSIAAGDGITVAAATSATATNTTVATTLVSNAGQVLGDSRAGLVNQAIKLGSLASGTASVDTLADSQGDSGMFEDLFGDQSSPYDGWNFSSGESDVAWSDAQNVDFGMGVIDGSGFDPNSITGFDYDPSNIAADDSDLIAMNSTPEVTTNDFGTTFDGPADDGAGGGSNWGGETSHVLMGAAPIAASAAKSAKDPSPAAGSASTGSSGAKASAIAAGSNDVLATIKNLYNVGAAAVGGAVTQAQSAVPRTYSGQLGATGGSTVNLPGMSVNTIAVIGGVLILAALVLHMNSKG